MQRANPLLACLRQFLVETATSADEISLVKRWFGLRVGDWLTLARLFFVGSFSRSLTIPFQKLTGTNSNNVYPHKGTGAKCPNYKATVWRQHIIKFEDLAFSWLHTNYVLALVMRWVRRFTMLFGVTVTEASPWGMPGPASLHSRGRVISHFRNPQCQSKKKLRDMAPIALHKDVL